MRVNNNLLYIYTRKKIKARPNDNRQTKNYKEQILFLLLLLLLMYSK